MSCITMTNSEANSFSTLFGRLSGSYLETYLKNLILFSENLTSSTVARSSGRTYARILKAHSHSHSMSGGSI